MWFRGLRVCGAWEGQTSRRLTGVMGLRVEFPLGFMRSGLSGSGVLLCNNKRRPQTYPKSRSIGECWVVASLNPEPDRP